MKGTLIYLLLGVLYTLWLLHDNNMEDSEQYQYLTEYFKADVIKAMVVAMCILFWFPLAIGHLRRKMFK